VGQKSSTLWAFWVTYGLKHWLRAGFNHFFCRF